jgi:molybdopterin molybdotransferase
MPEFLELIPPGDARNTFLEHFNHRVDSEVISSSLALGRITHGSIYAPHPMPSFNRSTVDGYAVRAEDTYGASDSLPAYLNLSGEIKMGTAPEFDLEKGCCALIHTGGMLPESANAVVMIEYTQSSSSTEIEIYHPVADGENILSIGEDIHPGQIVIQDGHLLNPAEIGGLAAIGYIDVQVSRKPRVAILSSGDEVVPPNSDLTPGKVRDINTYALQAAVKAWGGEPVPFGILPDRLEELTITAQKALEVADIVVFTAGSSASVRDLTSAAIRKLGPPGVLVHGVNVRPGKPTILAACQPNSSTHPKPVIGLPGNPVSALVIAGLFLKPIISKLLGQTVDLEFPGMTAELTINVASQAGREDWVPVRLSHADRGWTAEPVFGKSNLIFTLVRADGLMRIPADANGISSGSAVEIFRI